MRTVLPGTFSVVGSGSAPRLAALKWSRRIPCALADGGLMIAMAMSTMEPKARLSGVCITCVS